MRWIRCLLYLYLLDGLKYVGFPQLPSSQRNTSGIRNRIYPWVLAIYTRALLQTQYWDRTSLDMLQVMRYRKLLRITETAPFWKKTLAPTKKREPNASAALRRAPISYRKNLQQIPARELLSREGRAIRDTLMWRRTSGTTGVFFSWAFDPRMLYVDLASYVLRMLHNGGFEWKPGTKKFLYSLNHDLVGHPMLPFGTNLKWSPHQEDSESQIQKVISLLMTEEMPVLYTFPTDLWLFTQELQKRNVHPNLQLIITTGQMLEPEIRDFAEEYFRCPVRSNYASREIALIAMECKENTGQYHVNEEHNVIEILDDAGTPVPDGTWGNIIVSSLDNHAMPIIRYPIGDSGAFLPDGVCSCGITLRRFELSGRNTEFIKLPDGKLVSARQIGTFLLGPFFSRIYQYQIRQEKNGLNILIIPRHARLDEEAVTTITNTIEHMVGNSLPVTVEQVDSIAQTGTKIKRFVPLEN